MKLKFAKMHGLGNDFVVLDGIRQRIALTTAQLRFLADRHFGIGCDQVLLVEPAAQAGVDFRYRIFNADGGEVEQCGNGARCFVRFVHQAGPDEQARNPRRDPGRRHRPAARGRRHGHRRHGATGVSPRQRIPFCERERRSAAAAALADEEIFITAVGMGNPHAVQEVSDVDTAPVERQGPLIESHPRFPAAG
jgi:diaminopimelate epimerase